MGSGSGPAGRSQSQKQSQGGGEKSEAADYMTAGDCPSVKVATAVHLKDESSMVCS